MGVPRLFPYIQQTFPKAVAHVEAGEEVATVDNLYLDANGLLHGAAQEVFNYGDKKRVTDPYRHLDPQARTVKVFEIFFERMVAVTKMVKPRKLLYIAIDGPAPLAKQAQQRQRRFEAALRGIGVFNSNQITPGTLFMLELTKYLNTRIRQEINDGGWQSFSVIFSPPTVPGEGEHKILDYIRAIPSAKRGNDSHCMFGPDGDLIMLTLAAHLSKMFLFREDIYEVGYYHLLDMGKVRKELPYYLYEDIAIQQRRRTLDDATNDFILIGFFVGNDFLPHIKMFYRLETGLERMQEAYGFTNNKGTSDFITTGGHINHPGFLKFVEEIAKHERSFIANQATIQVIDERFRDSLVEKYADCIQSIRGTTECHFTEAKWAAYRKAYYAKSGIASKNLESGVKKICADYYKTLVWIFEYYVTTLPSWEWFYDWHYPPLMEDLVKYMRSLAPADIQSLTSFARGAPSLPFVQLLSVLPPSSIYLLPAPFHKLATSSDSPLVKAGYYPETFEIDYEGVYKEHMGVALLPFVDVAVIRKAYEPVAATLKNTYVRNSRGRVARFSYDDSVTLKYESDYGDIPKMHVTKTLL